MASRKFSPDQEFLKMVGRPRKFSENNKGKHRNIGSSNSNWRGGKSFEPYCPLFNKEFKERVRDFWNRKCGLCGKDEKDKHKLCVHHVNYDKKVCCNTTPPLFIPLCTGCHNKTHHKRNYWEEYFTNYIMIYYDGRMLFTNGGGFI